MGGKHDISRCPRENGLRIICVVFDLFCRHEAAYVLKTPKTVPLVRMLVLGYESKLKIENFFKAVDNRGKERSDGLRPFTFRPGRI